MKCFGCLVQLRKKKSSHINKEENSPSTSRVTLWILWAPGETKVWNSRLFHPPGPVPVSCVTLYTEQWTHTHTCRVTYTNTTGQEKKTSEIKSGEMKMYPSLIYWKRCANFFFLLMWLFVGLLCRSPPDAGQLVRKELNNNKKKKIKQRDWKLFLHFILQVQVHLPSLSRWGGGVGLDEGKLGH